MSSTQVETVSTGADKAKFAACGALVVAAVAAFYLLGQQHLALRVAALIVLLAGAVGVFLSSMPGQELIAFGRDAYKEVGKVVWPSGQEARQMTLYVFAFVVVMALFLWLTDRFLSWMLYSVLLGWR